MGSTSSKISVFEDEKEVFTQTLRHSVEELAPFREPTDQYEFRKGLVYAAIEAAGYKLRDFDAVCSRAGALTKMVSGTYLINEAVVDQASDVRKSGSAPHVLGIRIADAIAKEVSIPAYFCDPVTTDELADVARISGMKGVEKRSAFHALNHKAVARKTAAALGKKYEEVNLVGLHLGGGTSAAAHQHGQCVDICDCATDGAFSMDRPGSLPVRALVSWAFENFDSKAACMKVISRKGGIYSYLGLTDFREVCNRARSGDKDCKLMYDAFIYQQCRDVAAMACAMKFDVDAIFITGGIAFDEQVVADIKDRVGKIAPIYVFPGEEEMEALALGALRVLTGQEAVKQYVATSVQYE